MISGFQCSWCGVCFEQEHGYPVACGGCWEDMLDKIEAGGEVVEVTVTEDCEITMISGVQRAIERRL